MKHKNLITVVTDHQLTADTIAKAIGANEKHDGYYLGNGYAVTWTNGRVIEATFSPARASFFPPRWTAASSMPTTSSSPCATTTILSVTRNRSRTRNSSPQSKLSGK